MKYVEYVLIFELVLVQSYASHTKDTHYVSNTNFTSTVYSNK